MGEFSNGIVTKFLTSALSLLVIAVNVFFVTTFVLEELPSTWVSLVSMTVFSICYFGFIGYLSVYLLICLGMESLTKMKILQKFYTIEPFLKDSPTHP